MALTKISGSILKDPLNLGEVSIGGTLTYQDVTNVDALGIGTFRTGINVSGGQLDVGSNIKLGNAGVITATSFSGNIVAGAGSSNITAGIVTATRIVSTIGTFTGDTAISGSLQIADTIQHEGDVNTKIRFPSNDQISFETGGSERLRIRSDGNVGVGTDNPQGKFEVYGYGAAASGATPILAIRNGYAGTADTGNALSSELRFLHKNHNAAHEFMAARILAYTSDNYSQLTSLRFLVAQGNNGTERFRITSAGKISISDDGTTDGWLTIKQDASFNDVPHIRLIDAADSRESWISNHAGD